MIRIRGHHLLCALTFAGRGYSRQFERDFQAIAKRMRANEMMQIIDRPDEICQSVKDCDGSHCFEPRIDQRDALALADISELLGRELKVGDTLAPADIFTDDTRKAFRDNHIRRGCFDCQWRGFCDQIAADEFANTLLRAESV
ncbi:hypothetical protein MXMO3_00068 [Maritalea myrionectae]|uniref:2Fe-2S ferredoxin n=1 Tax=Maritalea myrionectae TaxID=454601 RepID=A0A2R4M9S4_9HYPH|nr:DUF1284 domain-containing protein [Maritalea myrionectae]AVX02616.1 hypothetical protein MXMO3_00068 [Maritalea myrionectae]